MTWKQWPRGIDVSERQSVWQKRKHWPCPKLDRMHWMCRCVDEISFEMFWLRSSMSSSSSQRSSSDGRNRCLACNDPNSSNFGLILSNKKYFKVFRKRFSSIGTQPIWLKTHLDIVYWASSSLSIQLGGVPYSSCNSRPSSASCNERCSNFSLSLGLWKRKVHRVDWMGQIRRSWRNAFCFPHLHVHRTYSDSEWHYSASK